MAGYYEGWSLIYLDFPEVKERKTPLETKRDLFPVIFTIHIHFVIRDLDILDIDTDNNVGKEKYYYNYK